MTYLPRSRAVAPAVLASLSAAAVLSVAGGAAATTIDERTVQKFHQTLSICGQPSPKGGARDGTAGCFQPLPTELYDGKRLLAADRAAFMQANAYIKKFKEQFNLAAQKWDQSKVLASHADSGFFLKTLKERQAYLKGAIAALQLAAPNIEAAEKRCGAFHQKYLTSNHQWMVKVFLGKETLNHRALAEKLAVIRKHADETAAGCADAQFAEVAGTDCGARAAMNRIVPETSPKVACEAAASRDGHIGRLIEGLVAYHMKAAKPPLDVREDGDIWTDRAFTLDELEFNEAAKKPFLDQFSRYFEDGGIKPHLDEAVFAGLKERFATARQRVEANLNTWKDPGSSNVGKYGTKLGTKAVQERYRNARVTKVAMTGANWYIIKNALGIPESREVSGFALFRVSGEKHCRSAVFTIREEYSGGGGYEKDSVASLNHERFLNCP